MYPLIIKHRAMRGVQQRWNKANPVHIGEYRRGEQWPDWVVPVGMIDGFSVEHRRSGYLWLTVPEGDMPSIEEMAEELRVDRMAQLQHPMGAALDLTALLMARGAVDSRGGWAGHSFDGFHSEAMHLLACGVDWTRSTTPGAEKWTEMIGTGESESTDMLSVGLFCRCSRDEHPRRGLYGVRFGFEMPSVAELIVALDARDLSRLFGDE